jgi:hypothetical protein
VHHYFTVFFPSGRIEKYQIKGLRGYAACGGYRGCRVLTCLLKPCFSSNTNVAYTLNGKSTNVDRQLVSKMKDMEVAISQSDDKPSDAFTCFEVRQKNSKPFSKTNNCKF